MDYINYYSTTLNSDTLTNVLGVILGAGLGATLGTIIIFASIISLVITVLQVVAMWKIFAKAGEEGWKCLIPIYGSIVAFRIAGISPWWLLAYLSIFIPLIGVLFIGFVNLGINIYYSIKLSESFEKSAAFAVGLIFLPTIFYLILAFDKSKYVSQQEVESTSTTEPVEQITETTKKVSEEVIEQEEIENKEEK